MNDFLNNVRAFLQKCIRLPRAHALAALGESFSLTERVALLALTVILAGSATGILLKINDSLLVEVPLYGGSLREGIIGSPRFINPILALGDADRDLVALVYSGLLKITPRGDLVPDLAEGYNVSSDGVSYTFTLKKNLTFHDGKPITADDVVFTIAKAQDPLLKSPKRAVWDGIRVEKVDERTVRFVLRQPYTPFLENTTMGILPQHLWRQVSIEQFPFNKNNIEPVGSGPYMVASIEKDRSGVPLSYTLVPFPRYALGEPYIAKISIFFSGSEEGLLQEFENGATESINTISGSFAKKLAEQNARVERSPLPRVFAVFFNQNQAQVFSHKEVRAALNAALDKERIVREVLRGYGSLIDGPIPPGLLESLNGNGGGNVSPSSEPDDAGASERIEKARALLAAKGWVFNEKEGVMQKKLKKGVEDLSFSLATSDITELKKTALLIAETWRKLGARIDVKIFESGDLNQNVIRPRKYDALLFGEIVGRDLDLFAFWHSSQRVDPGLNIALYANITADKLLEKARATLDEEKRAAAYRDFQKEVSADVPVVFLYAPDFIYVLPQKIRGVSLGAITTPSERFSAVHQWYSETERVWPIFVKK